MDDKLPIVYPKAAGIGIHKMAITVSTRIVDGAGALQRKTDRSPRSTFSGMCRP